MNEHVSESKNKLYRSRIDGHSRLNLAYTTLDIRNIWIDIFLGSETVKGSVGSIPFQRGSRLWQIKRPNAGKKQ